MNRAHFGVADWIEDVRLKAIREDLQGVEVKGIDIVNIHFFESAKNCNPSDTWYRLISAIEYNLVYDINSLVHRDPLTNIEELLHVASRLAASAPWPQVRTLGHALCLPLTAQDEMNLQRSLEKWSTFVDRAGERSAAN
jgi:hypothetical protein